MRAITPGVKVVGGLLGIRACLLLIFVFVCAIDRSSTIDATIRRTTVALSFRRPGSLTDEQLKSAVTIEFNFKGIDRNNRTAVEIAYREVRRKILELLNRRKSTSTSPSYSTTTVPKTTTVAAATDAATTINPTSTTTATTTTARVTTIATSSAAATTTTSTPATTPTTTVTTTPTSTRTTAAPTTTPTPSVVETTTQTLSTVPTTSVTTGATPPDRVVEGGNRRRRNSGGNTDTLTNDDLHFVGNDHEFNENEQLRIYLLIDKERLGDLDLGELLHEAANALNKSGEFEASPRIHVNVYKGLPKELSPVEASQLGFNFWLPVLLASSALLLIFIFTFARFWSSSRNKKMGGALDREKLISGLMG